MTNPSRCDIIIMSRGDTPYIVKNEREKNKMKLTNTQKADKAQHKITFEDIHDGEVFYYEDDLYLKLSEDVYISGAHSSTEYGAVSLVDGSLAQFYPTEEVGRFATEPELVYDSNTVKYAE